MQISNILENLIKNPHSPIVYRKLRDYYIENGRHEEAMAIKNLLKLKFKEIESEPYHRK